MPRPEIASLLTLQSAQFIAEMRKARGQITDFSRSVKNVGSTLTGVFATGQIIRGIANIVTFTDNLSKLSKATGFTTKELQELRFGFGQTGVETLRLDKNLEAFSRRIGAFARDGTGPAAVSLKQLGISMQDIRDRTPSEALKLVANRMRELRNETLQINVAQDLFSESGRRMVNLLRQGEAALVAYAVRARQLGLVIDDDLIRNAEQLNDRFTETIDVLGVQGKKAFLQIAPAISVTAKAVTEFVQASKRSLSGLGQGLTILTAPGKITKEWLLMQASAPRAGELARRRLSAIISSPLPATTGGILGAAALIGEAWQALPQTIRKAVSRAKQEVDRAFEALSPSGAAGKALSGIVGSGAGSTTDIIAPLPGENLSLAALGDLDSIKAEIDKAKKNIRPLLKDLIKSNSATVKEQTLILTSDIKKSFDQILQGEGSLEQRFKEQNFAVQESIESMMQAVEKTLAGERFRFIVNDVDNNLKRISESFQQLKSNVVDGFEEEEEEEEEGFVPNFKRKRGRAVSFAAAATGPGGAIGEIAKLTQAMNELREVARLAAQARPGEIDAETASQLQSVDIALSTKELNKENIALAKSYLLVKDAMQGIRSVGRNISSTLGSMVEGVALGTRKMDTLWSDFLQVTLLNLFRSTFSSIMDTLFDSLAKGFGESALGAALGAFSGGGGGIAGARTGGRIQVRGFGRGGRVPGQGSGDIIPALLEPQEGVVNRQGMGILERLNEGLVPREFAGSNNANVPEINLSVTLSNIIDPSVFGKSDEEIVTVIANDVQLNGVVRRALGGN